MSDAADMLIGQALEKIKGLEQQIAPIMGQITELRITVNSICKLVGRDPMFADVSAAAIAAGAPAPTANELTIKNDLFVGKPLAGAAKTYLDMRYKRAGESSPASVDEIHTALVAGGFEFPTRDIENQKRGLAVSLTKNSYSFRRLNNGLYGLVEWYGAAKRAPRKNGEAEAAPVAEAESGEGESAPPSVEEMSK
jgi:hypothetical protein